MLDTSFFTKGYLAKGWVLFLLLLFGYFVLQATVLVFGLPQSLISLYPWIVVPLAGSRGRKLVYALLLTFTLLSFVGASQSVLEAAERANAYITIAASLFFIALCVEVILRNVRHLRVVNHELSSACAQAESASVAKGKFLAVMSHEVRTPLSGILGMTELLVRDEQEPKKKQSLALVHRSAEDLMQMVNSILDFSRLESGKMELHSEPFAIRAMLAQLMTSFRALAEKKNLQLELKLDSSLPERLCLDKHRLRQVLANLLTNSIKFTQVGRIELSVDKLASEQGDIIQFSVTDTGIGISEERLQVLFEPFEQVNSSYNRAQEGTGLGLSIARDIVRLMGSEIKVLSTPGLGSRFSFAVSIPELVESTSSTVLPEPPDPSKLLLWLKHPRVLIAEDSEVNRTYLELMLKNLGCHFVAAEDGEQAVDMALQDDFDLYLFDLHMPKLSGLETLTMIRQRQPDRQVPALALTACSLAEEQQDIENAGFIGLYLKPLRQAQLANILAEHCRDHLLYSNS